MNTIGIIINLAKPEILKITGQIVDWLEEHGKKVLVSSAGSCDVNDGIISCSEQELAQQAECVIVLGGDGTLLNCARTIGVLGKPIFGVNLGQLGFLTETELPDLIPALERLISGEFKIEERMMIQAEVFRNGDKICNYYCLNDAVITKGAFARLIRLKTFVNNEYVDIFPADGLIISTPTGSTAYSLSAGGPLVAPNLELMIVTPICPHTLYSRSVVVDRDSEVKVELLGTQAEVMLTIDGQSGLQLIPQDQVVIRKAPFTAKFLKLNQRSFYEILRKKLRESGNTDV